MKLYKFRSLNEHTKDELQNNYLYFATPDELNDPMEGFIKLYWDGDIVLWKNFFNHYLYTMTYSVISAIIQPELLHYELPIFLSEDKFPLFNYNNYKDILISIRNNFFNEEVIVDLLECLQYFYKESHKVSQVEIESYLGFIKFHAFYNIVTELNKRDILNYSIEKPESINTFKQLKEFIPSVEEKYSDTEYSDLINKLFAVTNNIMDDIILSQKIEIQNIDDITKFFIYDFNKLYVKQIKNIVCSNPCTTCFMEQCDSPALWGYYGNNHKGICLIFDDKKDSTEIKFTLKKKGYTIKTQTQRVKYQKKICQYKFFPNAG